MRTKKNIIIIMILIFIGVNISFYIKERIHWMGEGHTNLQAKEYYILGNMVFFYRKILNIIFDVDNPIMYPLNKLQELIYNKGSKYLPNDDGEIAIWKYKFYLYFYVHKDYMPDFTPKYPNDISSERIALLDEIYWTIETLATKRITDKEMNEEMKYMILPNLATFYDTKQTNYFGTKSGFYRTQALMDSSKHMQRVENIIEWLTKFKSEWTTVLEKKIYKQHPVIIVNHYFALHENLTYLIRKNLNSKTFDCKHPYTDLFVKSRDEMYGDGESSALFRLPKRQTELYFDMIFIGTEMSNEILYLLHQKCGIEFKVGYPSEEWIDHYQELLKKKQLQKSEN